MKFYDWLQNWPKQISYEGYLIAFCCFVNTVYLNGLFLYQVGAFNVKPSFKRG